MILLTDVCINKSNSDFSMILNSVKARFFYNWDIESFKVFIGIIYI